MVVKARWYWLCVGSGGCVMEHGCAELITVDHLKDSIRGMKQDESPEEYRRIMDEARAIGCFYCMAETPGCGLVKVEREFGSGNVRRSEPFNSEPATPSQEDE